MVYAEHFVETGFKLRKKEKCLGVSPFRTHIIEMHNNKFRGLYARFSGADIKNRSIWASPLDQNMFGLIDKLGQGKDEKFGEIYDNLKESGLTDLDERRLDFILRSRRIRTCESRN